MQIYSLMLLPRIIVCLLLHRKGLVKTTRFKDPKYVGDPLNAVRIFNEKQVDELIVADIDASVCGNEPDYKTISHLASECRMPLCYVGGVKTSEQIERIISLGVEKVALGSAAVETPSLITDASKRVGSQSIVVVMDVKKVGLFKKYEVFIHNGKKSTGLNPIEFAIKSEQLGAGEILLNSIDHDGVMKGYDLDLIDNVRDKINLPLSILGGAGSLEDIKKIVHRYGVIGIAAGSIFVFKGKYRAVLIQYPSHQEKTELLSET